MQFEDPKSLLEAAAAKTARPLDAHGLLKQGARLRRARAAAMVAGLAIAVAGASISVRALGTSDDRGAPGPAGNVEAACDQPAASATIYLRDDASRKEIRALRRDLQAAEKELVRAMGNEARRLRGAPGRSPGVAKLEYISKEEAYEEFRNLYEGRPELLETLPRDSLPASFRVQVADAEDLVRVLETSSRAIENVESRPDPAVLECLAEMLCDRPIPLELAIFVREGASQAQVEDLRQKLAARDDIASLEYISKKEAYEEFRKLYEDQPELFETIPRRGLPASFRIEATDEAALARLEELESPAIEEILGGFATRDGFCPDRPATADETVRAEAGEAVDLVPVEGETSSAEDVRLLRAECNTGRLDLGDGGLFEFDDGSKWCRFVLLVKNTSPEPLELDPGAQMLWARNGNALTQWELAVENQYLSARLFEAPIEPGETVIGHVIFLLDPDQVPASLELELSPGLEPISFPLDYDCAADLREEPRGRCFFTPPQNR